MWLCVCVQAIKELNDKLVRDDRWDSQSILCHCVPAVRVSVAAEQVIIACSYMSPGAAQGAHLHAASVGWRDAGAEEVKAGHLPHSTGDCMWAFYSLSCGHLTLVLDNFLLPSQTS